MKKVEYINKEYYHIYNRGVDKRQVFEHISDYFRFLRGIKEFNQPDSIGSLYENEIRKRKRTSDVLGHRMSKSSKLDKDPLVDVICYCLNPNHYHFILRQVKDKGISKFMQKLGNGYTKYFNRKYDRSGSLFQGKFKVVHIDTEQYLLYLSVYVNCNNFIHGYTDSLKGWQFSSYLDFIGQRNGKICKKDIVYSQLGGIEKNYEEFCKENALYLKEKKEMERLLIE